MNRSLFLIASCALAFSASGAVLPFTYGLIDGRHYAKGTGNPEKYDVCIRIDNAAFVGSKITSISVPIPAKGGSVSPECSAWVISELPGEGEALSPLSMAEAKIVDNVLTATFESPVTVGDSPLYVGYTVDVTDCDAGTAAYPIACVAGRIEGGLYYRSENYTPKWHDSGNAKSNACVSEMTVTLEGDFPANSCVLTLTNAEPYSTPGGEAVVRGLLTNYGSAAVNNIEVAYLPEGEKESVPVAVELETPLEPLYGASQPISFKIPGGKELGESGVRFTLAKVNGAETVDAQPVSAMLKTVPFIPKHRPIVEEYTGLWCTWCPSGYVALEQGKYYYGDDFVALSYHNGDEMAMRSSLFPSRVTGYPSIFIDRGSRIDIFTTMKEWETAAALLAPGSIEVKAEWADDNNEEIVVTSTTRFIENHIGANFAVSYALVADGLSNPSWAQGNEYFGDEGIGMVGPYWDTFTKGDRQVYGLTFNDIVVNYNDPRGIVGSIPSDIEAERAYTHSSRININDAISAKTGNLIWQNKDKLRVVAVLCNPETRVAYNAISSDYASTFGKWDSVRGIDAESDSPVVSKRYYDMQGRELMASPTGVPYVVISLHEDGTLSTEKRFDSNR